MGIGKNCSNICIIGVYLPQQGCQIAKYSHHLAEVESIIEQNKANSEIVMIGDFNCQLGPEYGNRLWGTTSVHGQWVGSMAERLGLNILDSDYSNCKGPNYSFYVEGVGCSYIDHCIISRSLLNLVTDCAIIEETLENLSDHLPPIAISINVDTIPGPIVSSSGERIAWDKQSSGEIQNEYTNILNKLLYENINADYHCSCAEDVNNLFIDIVNLIYTSSTNLKRCKFSKGLKPYWDNDLGQLQKSQKSKWIEWKEAGCPRNGTLYEQYKEAKRLFRRTLRQSKLNYEKHEMQTIAQAHEMDQKSFWSLVNKSKAKPKMVSPVQVDNVTLTDAGAIREAWKGYFQDLYTPKNAVHYDGEFRENVEQTLKEMVVQSHSRDTFIMSHPISYEEVDSCIKQLKNKKAPGWDQITAEHLKYGGESLTVLLIKLFNAMVEYETIPRHLKIGIIIPIPKGDKDPTLMGNNRGITLLPIVGKVFEKILLNRHLTWAKRNDPIDPLQGAAQDHCSSIHTSLLLQETIAYNMERDSPVYVTMLDIHKAFYCLVD